MENNTVFFYIHCEFIFYVTVTKFLNCQMCIGVYHTLLMLCRQQNVGAYIFTKCDALYTKFYSIYVGIFGSVNQVEPNKIICVPSDPVCM